MKLLFFNTIPHTKIYLQLNDTKFHGNNGTLGTAVAQWLRRCATNRNVAGLIPDGVIGIFH